MRSAAAAAAKHIFKERRDSGRLCVARSFAGGYKKKEPQAYRAHNEPPLSFLFPAIKSSRVLQTVLYYIRYIPERVNVIKRKVNGGAMHALDGLRLTITGVRVY